MYDDIVILEVEEGMNEGKTHAYFAWAAQYAEVPDCQYARPGSPSSSYRSTVTCLGTRPPDYIVKADDDSFIVLTELERRLRIIPREKAYWGCESSTPFYSQLNSFADSYSIDGRWLT